MQRDSPSIALLQLRFVIAKPCAPKADDGQRGFYDTVFSAIRKTSIDFVQAVHSASTRTQLKHG